jgi:hypothetical protein
MLAAILVARRRRRRYDAMVGRAGGDLVTGGCVQASRHGVYGILWVSAGFIYF